MIKTTENTLTIIQVDDTLRVNFDPYSIDLIITSPSNDFLVEHTDAMFKWIDGCLSSNGVCIIEAKGMFGDHNFAINRYICRLIEKRVECKLNPQFCFPFYHIYAEWSLETLYFLTYKKDLERPKQIPYRKHSDREMKHQCEFDSLLISELIRRYSKPGDVVLDPFCGTGVVPREAFRLGRTGIGLDRRCPFTNEETL